MKNELVSIIITAFNEEKYIERAITSALNQSYDRIEVIVIDDGSNDKTLSSTVPVCRQPSGNGQGAGHYLPRNFYASDPQGWIPTPRRADWCGNVDTTLRISLKPQYTFSHPVSGWGLCISRRSITPISTPQSPG